MSFKYSWEAELFLNHLAYQLKIIRNFIDLLGEGERSLLRLPDRPNAIFPSVFTNSCSKTLSNLPNQLKKVRRIEDTKLSYSHRNQLGTISVEHRCGVNYMATEDIKRRFALQYDEDKDDFFVVENKKVDQDLATYLIIDETEEKMTLSFQQGVGLVQKRTIERRVNSYIKTGFPLNYQGEAYRVGAGYELDKLNAEEKLSDVLLTHGHSYGRAKLVRDEMPDYVEDTTPYEVRPQETSAPQQATTQEPQPTTKPTATPQAAQEATGSVFKTSGSSSKASDDQLFALGQFVDQFVRKGKLLTIGLDEEGSYHLIMKEGQTIRLEKVEGHYKLQGLDLFEL